MKQIIPYGKQNITQEITTKENHAREAAPETKAVEQLKAEPSIGLMADPVCDEPILEEKIPDEEPEPKAAAPRSEKSKSASQQEFESFWSAYELKVGKGEIGRAHV